MNSPKSTIIKRVPSDIFINVNSSKNIKLLVLLLSQLHLSLYKSNIQYLNNKASYLRIAILISTISSVGDLPKIDQASSFITKSNLLNSAKDVYLTLFNLFLTLGLGKKNIFFFDSNGPFSRVLDVLNWFMYRVTSTNNLSTNKLDYKRFVTRGLINRVGSNISCAILLPSLTANLKKMILKLRTPYVVHIDKSLTHRGNKYMPPLSPKHILVISNLFFFYKKGLNDYSRKKLYKLILLMVRK